MLQHKAQPSLVKLNPSLSLGLREVNETALSLLRQTFFWWRRPPLHFWGSFLTSARRSHRGTLLSATRACRDMEPYPGWQQQQGHAAPSLVRDESTPAPPPPLAPRRGTCRQQAAPPAPPTPLFFHFFPFFSTKKRRGPATPSPSCPERRHPPATITPPARKGRFERGGHCDVTPGG